MNFEMKLMRLMWSFWAALLMSGTVWAQSYPNKPIRIIVPFPPGGANDIAMRTLNLRLPSLLGQTLIIDNRAGAGGNVGAELAAKTPADGYTLLAANNSLIMSASLYRKLPYDPFRDFAPIAMMATSPNMIVAHPQLPTRTVKELIALAKSQPGQLSYGSPGPGTSSHLAGELFKVRTGTNIVHIAYKGAGPLTVDQIGGHVMLSFSAPIVSKPYIDSGKLRAIAVTSEKRWATMPNLPSVAESGYPDYQVSTWYGLYTTAGTPRNLINTLNGLVNKALTEPQVAKSFSSQGAEPLGGRPEDLTKIMRDDYERWRKLIAAAKLQVE